MLELGLLFCTHMRWQPSIPATAITTQVGGWLAGLAALGAGAWAANEYGYINLRGSLPANIPLPKALVRWPLRFPCTLPPCAAAAHARMHAHSRARADQHAHAHGTARRASATMVLCARLLKTSWTLMTGMMAAMVLCWSGWPGTRPAHMTRPVAQADPTARPCGAMRWPWLVQLLRCELHVPAAQVVGGCVPPALHPWGAHLLMLRGAGQH